MRTSIVVDDELIEKALRCSGLRTKREVVHKALQEFVENRRRLNLLDLEGKIKFAKGYDHQKLEGGIQ